MDIVEFLLNPQKSRHADFESHQTHEPSNRRMFIDKGPLVSQVPQGDRLPSVPEDLVEKYLGAPTLSRSSSLSTSTENILSSMRKKRAHHVPSLSLHRRSDATV